MNKYKQDLCGEEIGINEYKRLFLDEKALSIIRKQFVEEILAHDIPNNSVVLPDNLKYLLLLDVEYKCFSDEAYFTISKRVIPILKKINLSGFDWEDVDVSHINFTDCNAVINPQIVYQRDFSYGVYPLDFTGMNFDYCNIENSDFRGSKGVIYNLSHQEEPTFGKNGHYPITFIGKVPNDERFKGCICIPEISTKQMTDEIHEQIKVAVKKAIQNASNN